MRLRMAGVPLNIFDKRYRHFHRYRRVLEVLLRHGFGYLVEQVGLPHLIPWRWRVLRRHPRQGTQSVGARLRVVLEELGPTYIKLGQLLSTRPDLLPADILAELAKLQDKVAAFSSAAAIKQIETETGRPLDELFSSFEKEPLAAASIGQVHRAVLPDGAQVVVKVQRPGVAQLVATDLEIVTGLARRVQERLKPPTVNLNDLAGEFARTMRRELDYTIEARQIDRFRRDFVGDVHIHFPAVHWQLTTKRMLTMAYLAGIKVDQLELLDKAGIDRRTVARRCAEAFMKQVMVHGFFHADPHPGNIMVLPGAEIAFVDLGMVGRLSEGTRELLKEILQGVTRRDMGRVCEALVDMGAVQHERLGSLQRDLEDLAACNYGIPLRQIDVTGVLRELEVTAVTHGVRLPQDLLMLVKALFIIEGVTRKLDPDFNIAEVAEPLARQMMLQQFNPVQAGSRVGRIAQQYLRVFGRLPKQVDRLVTQLERGELAVQFKHVGLENVVGRLDIISNRLAVAIMVAALIIGSALVLSQDLGPLFHGLPVVGLCGFVAAACTGAWLVVAILRSGRI